jgi:hypothetical protein
MNFSLKFICPYASLIRVYANVQALFLRNSCLRFNLLTNHSLDNNLGTELLTYL